MVIPSFKALVEQIQAQRRFPIATLEGCGQLVRASAGPIHAADPRFVMLRKKAGRTHVVDSKGRLHAADVLLFVESPTKAIAVDIIGSSASPEAKVAWSPERDKVTKQLVYRYTAADGFAPDYEDEPAPEPPVSEPPSSDLEVQIGRVDARLRAVEAWVRSFPT